MPAIEWNAGAPRRRLFSRSLGAVSLAGLLAACAGPPTDSIQPVFPDNYRETFAMVRDCRNSSAHPSTIRVYVNDIGSAAYLADADPLPEGTIVIKEAFTGTTCDTAAELGSWVAMLKRQAGYDPEDGDWQWQRVVAPDRTVLTNDKTTCIECHRAAECLTRDYMCTEP